MHCCFYVDIYPCLSSLIFDQPDLLFGFYCINIATLPWDHNPLYLRFWWICRLSDTHGERDNEKEPGNPQQHVLAVGPLNSIPYFNPDMLESWSPEADNEKVERAGPGVILPKKEWDDSIDATRRGVGLTRTAALGMVGPSVGLLDIGEMEDSYMFRVSLPGVAANESKLLYIPSNFL